MENNENNEQAGYVPNRVIDKSVLKTYFENGDIPNEEEFWEWQDSYWHKTDVQDIIPAERVDLSGKLDKPTVDGNWVVAKFDNTITYTDASNFVKNIYNTDGTLGGNRVVTMNGNSVNFSGGQFKSDIVTFTPKIANASAATIWVNSSDGRLKYTDNLGVSYNVAYDNQVLKTISADTILDDTYHNCIVRITANSTISVPLGLRSDFNCVFDAIGAATGTFAVVAGSGITISAPFGLMLKDNTMCTLYKVTSTTFRLNGGLIPA